MVESYRFEATLWVAQGNGAWHFVSLPDHEADEILARAGSPGRGFGSVRVSVTIGGSSWDTSVFPDSKRGTYVLPIKKAVRMAERLTEGDVVTVGLEVADGQPAPGSGSG
ncbi:MAG TPA: DUF1905 domain-containing protein [Kineosporiaceae bacterium]|nr:DUF1905 domain-containing protein [Kineosporiaceae bacterium]